MKKSWMKGQWSFSAELYYRHLGNQLDYTGGVMEFLDGSYTLDGALQRGSGRNYGLNLMLSKTAGKFTGWVAFAAGRSLRTFDGETRPSDHERLVELNVVASYRVGPWDFGGSFICAGGTPFSEPQEYYMVGSQLVAVFNGQNNGRLEPYVRLDLSTRFHCSTASTFPFTMSWPGNRRCTAPSNAGAAWFSGTTSLCTWESALSHPFLIT